MSKQDARLALAAIAVYLTAATLGFVFISGEYDNVFARLAVSLLLGVALPFSGLLGCFLAWRALQLCYYGPIFLVHGLLALSRGLWALGKAAISGPDAHATAPASVVAPAEAEALEQSFAPGTLSRPSSLAQRV